MACKHKGVTLILGVSGCVSQNALSVAINFDSVSMLREQLQLEHCCHAAPHIKKVSKVSFVEVIG